MKPQQQLARALRAELGQKGAAKAAGVGTSTMRRWEQGGGIQPTQLARLRKTWDDVQRARGERKDPVERAFDTSREEILAVLDRLESDVRRRPA